MMYSSVEYSTLGKVGSDAVVGISLDSPKIDKVESDGSWFVSTYSNIPDYNMGYFGYGGRRSDPEKDLYFALRYLKKIGRSGFIFTAEDFSVSRRFRNTGLEYVSVMPLMERVVSGRNIQNDYLHPVTTLRGIRQANVLQSAAFEFPRTEVDRIMGGRVLGASNVDVFLLNENGQPKSTVTAVNHNLEGVSFWNMSTSPDLQRQGYGRKLLDGAMRYYENRGTNRFFLVASQAGIPLYRKLGFNTLAHTNAWIANP